MYPSPDFLKQYFEYVVWADRLHLQVVAALPEAEVTRTREFSFGSILKLLQHELAAQKVWLDRFESVPSVWYADSPEIDTLAKLTEKWEQLHQRGRNYFASLTPEILSATFSYTSTEGPSYTQVTGDMVFHMCQHSYYHRSQLNSMIDLAGGEPVSTDYCIWIAQR